MPSIYVWFRGHGTFYDVPGDKVTANDVMAVCMPAIEKLYRRIGHRAPFQNKSTYYLKPATGPGWRDQYKGNDEIVDRKLELRGDE